MLKGKKPGWNFLLQPLKAFFCPELESFQVLVAVVSFYIYSPIHFIFYGKFM